MTFRLFRNDVRRLVKQALDNAGYPAVEFDVSEPPQKEFGDLSCNVAFLLARHAKKPPQKIAAELVEAIRLNIKDTCVLSAETAGGHINFKADYSRLSPATLGQVLKSPENYGYPDSGQGRHIVIEHTSVNPNKALHVGHMRNVIIGDTLYRIMKATNHRTTVLNYVDDSGLQVADIVVGFKFSGFNVEPPKGKKFDHYCGDEVYVKINEMYEKDPLLAEKRKLVLKEIEEGKSEIARFATDITLRVLNEQLKTCWRMKARYDLLNFESHIVVSKLWSKTFELLKKERLTHFEEEGKNKGCWVIEAKDEEDKVLVRSDGTATYIAKDIPYAAWKLGLIEDPFSYREYLGQWDGSMLYATTLGGSDKPTAAKKFNGGERVITIIDSRQARLQRIISQVLSKIGAGTQEYFHLSYEAVTLSSETAKAFGIDIGDRQFMHMSGRKGIYVNADYVLDTLHTKAYEEVKTRNPGFTEEQLNAIAEEIAISAIRYNMIKQDLDKIITFDVKESLSLEGDTGPYLQYAYARSQRILEKSGQDIAGSNFAFDRLAHESEIALIKEIAKLDLVVEDAAKSLSPKSLARYAYNLATTFNLFYEKVPVLKEQDADIRMARLALVKAFGVALKNALDVLGITALDHM
ncbi:arginine--tRNA ligase [Candidatus Nitrososphaera gargensis Ga9.2]|uniref:Arginine--tRNA ligase n=1 Tax=Nitrososphaera gargensis (strain Ga9.2) TaxID=1237085 RepID=K0IM12_NITGG|nr:arginine--tRNA ligase [Candidatus Nitrososphaera gargensis]AFU57499.1 arginine--tRNA ligase [Candidatus Nitrososphaera gargensis Ga9.2]